MRQITTRCPGLMEEHVRKLQRALNACRVACSFPSTLTSTDTKKGSKLLRKSYKQALDFRPGTFILRLEFCGVYNTARERIEARSTYERERLVLTPAGLAVPRNLVYRAPDIGLTYTQALFSQIWPNIRVTFIP